MLGYTVYIQPIIYICIYINWHIRDGTHIQLHMDMYTADTCAYTYVIHICMCNCVCNNRVSLIYGYITYPASVYLLVYRNHISTAHYSYITWLICAYYIHTCTYVYVHSTILTATVAYLFAYAIDSTHAHIPSTHIYIHQHTSMHPYIHMYAHTYTRHTAYCVCMMCMAHKQRQMTCIYMRMYTYSTIC